MSPFLILGMPGLFYHFILVMMENPVANTVVPDQMPHYVASDLGLHCLPALPMTFLREWVKPVVILAWCRHWCHILKFYNKVFFYFLFEMQGAVRQIILYKDRSPVILL